MFGAQTAAQTATALADLFFKADRVLSQADETRANQLRLNYRKWRLKDEAAGPHADVLVLNHSEHTQQSRSEAKFKRVKTVGDRIFSMENEAGSSVLENEAPASTADNEAASSAWSRSTSPTSCQQVQVEVADGTPAPSVSPEAQDLSTGEAIKIEPLTTGGAARAGSSGAALPQLSSTPSSPGDAGPSSAGLPSSLISPSNGTKTEVSPSRAPRFDESERPLSVAQSADGVLGVPSVAEAAPILRTGGCPFRQGDTPVDGPLPIPPVQGQSEVSPSCAPVPGGCPFRQPSSTADSPLPEAAWPPSAADAGAGSGSAVMDPAAGFVIPAPPSLSPDQLAAFQAAYMKALAELQAPQDTCGGPLADASSRQLLAPQSSTQLPGRAPDASAPLAATSPPHLQLGSPSMDRPNGSASTPAAAGLNAPDSCREGALAPGSAAGKSSATRNGVGEGGGAAPKQGKAAAARGQGAGSSAGDGGADDEEDEVIEGKILATSCAHGPLVTHPDKSAASAMLASVFPSSKESWLYVVMSGEFGAPWAVGINSLGCAYGRLQFKSKMQQWVLLQVEPADWEQIKLPKILPAMARAWGEIAPPKKHSRWICFPYLCAEPASILDLHKAFSEGNYEVDPSADDLDPPLQPPVIPEATVQRDIKAIGARGASGRNSGSRAARKRAQRASGAAGAVPGELDGAGMAMQLTASQQDAMKRQRLTAEWQNSLMGITGTHAPAPVSSLPQNMNIPTSLAELLHSLAGLQAARQSGLAPQPAASAGGGATGGGGMLPPSSSMLQLLQYLESCNNAHMAAGRGGNACTDRAPNDPSMPSSASVASLLGLLRSNSLQQSLADLGHSSSSQDLASGQPHGQEAGSDGGIRSVLDLQSLATLARAASTEGFEGAASSGAPGSNSALSLLQLMPPPQPHPASQSRSHAIARNALSAAAMGNSCGEGTQHHHDVLSSLLPGASLKESASVSSLVDMVRSSSASSLVELMNSYSATNLAGMVRDEGNPPDWT